MPRSALLRGSDFLPQPERFLKKKKAEKPFLITRVVTYLVRLAVKIFHGSLKGGTDTTNSQLGSALDQLWADSPAGGRTQAESSQDHILGVELSELTFCYKFIGLPMLIVLITD